MNLRAKIAVVAASVFLAGCREMPGYFASDTTLARAGGKQLQLRDVESVVPKGVTGEDSAAFMKVYVDRWVRKQLKLKEAETLFSASGDDIDKSVIWLIGLSLASTASVPNMASSPRPNPFGCFIAAFCYLLRLRLRLRNSRAKVR